MTNENYNPVLESTQPLVDNSHYVTINAEALEESSKRYASTEMKIPDWRGPMFPEDPGEKPAFLLVGNAINFAYSDFETGEKWQSTEGEDLPAMSGAFGMWASLRKAMKQGEPILDGRYLSSLTKKQGEKIFAGNIEIPLLDEKLENLQVLGEHLEVDYNNEFNKLISSADGKLFGDTGLVSRLQDMAFVFDDWVSLKKLGYSDNTYDIAYFNKRAQLVAGMLIGAGLFPDNQADQLTVFADYNLPNELRHQRILEYKLNLAERIDKQTPIAAGSREEVEIRASTVHAADRIIKKVNELREDPINALHLDAQLFFDGRNRKKKGTERFPHHLTRTIAY
jgi:hypothetical protein